MGSVSAGFKNTGVPGCLSLASFIQCVILIRSIAQTPGPWPPSPQLAFRCRSIDLRTLRAQHDKHHRAVRANAFFFPPTPHSSFSCHVTKSYAWSFAVFRVKCQYTSGSTLMSTPFAVVVVVVVVAQKQNAGNVYVRGACESQCSCVDVRICLRHRPSTDSAFCHVTWRRLKGFAASWQMFALSWNVSTFAAEWGHSTEVGGETCLAERIWCVLS